MKGYEPKFRMQPRPAVLEPLIVGLKEKGFCFATLRQHPAYKTRIVANYK